MTRENVDTGTGFFYEGWRGSPGKAPLLVTAQHVVKDIERGQALLVRDIGGRPKLGDTVSIDFAAEDWTHHPTADVSVMFVGPKTQHLLDGGTPPYYRTITNDLLPSEDELQSLDAVEPVTVVGYPASMIDSTHGTPLVRRGHTATPVHLDFDGRPEFLVDANATTGSSGSPVLIVHENGFRTPHGYRQGVTRVLSAGVLTGASTRTTIRPVIGDSNLNVETEEAIHLGHVANWRVVEETVDAAFAKLGIDRPASGASNRRP